MAIEYSCTINGVERTLLKESINIREATDGINTLTGEVLSEGDETPPAIDHEIIVRETDSGSSPAPKIYAGLISAAPTKGWRGPNDDDQSTRISAVDYKRFADWRFVTETIPAGTLKAALEVLEQYLTPYGVALDPSQATGPSLPELIYDGKKLAEVLVELAGLTSWTWDIDYDKFLRMTEPGSVAAPVNLIEGNRVEVGDLEVEPTQEDRANRIVVIAGTNSTLEKTATFTGDGATNEFVLPYRLAGHRGGVLVDSVFETLDINDPNTTSAKWGFDSTTGTIKRYVFGTNTPDPPGIGIAIAMVFDAQFPIRVQSPLAEDEPTPEQTPWLRERQIAAPDVFDRDVAQAIADAALAAALLSPKIVRYSTVELGIRPGQTQRITSTRRNIDADCLIQEVVTQLEPGGEGLIRSITAITLGESGSPSGTASSQLPSFRKVYRDWMGNGGAAASPPPATTVSRMTGIPPTVMNALARWGDVSATTLKNSGVVVTDGDGTGRFGFSPWNGDYVEALFGAYVIEGDEDEDDQYIPTGTSYVLLYHAAGGSFGLEFIYDETPGVPTDWDTYKKMGAVFFSADEGVDPIGAFRLYGDLAVGIAGFSFLAQGNESGDRACGALGAQARNGEGRFIYPDNIDGFWRALNARPNTTDTTPHSAGTLFAMNEGATMPQGRLTLTTGTPDMTASVTGATTVYYTPAIGNRVPIYNGTFWAAKGFAQLSQATSDSTKSPAAAAAYSNYDLFAWDDSGTLRCTRGPAWTQAQAFTVTIASPGVFTCTGHGFYEGMPLVFSTTGALPTGLTAGTVYFVIAAGLTANAFQVSTSVGGAAVNTSGSQSGVHTATQNTTVRGTGAGTTELEYVNGILVNKVDITNGPAAQRGTYVGTIRTNGSSQVDMIFGGAGAAGGEGTTIGLWNMYNRREIVAVNFDNTDSWNYTTNTLRVKNGNAANRIQCLTGWLGDALSAVASQVGSNSTAGIFQGVTIGLDSMSAQATTAALGAGRSTGVSTIWSTVSTYEAMAPLGFHYVAPLERSTATGTSTWYGDNGATDNISAFRLRAKF